jgi:hypothetical protein
MSKRTVLTLIAVALSGAMAAAQSRETPQTGATTKPVVETAPAVVKPVPEAPPPAANVRIEVSITDQTGTGTPARKVVSMIAGDRNNTNIRSSASVPVKSMGGMVNYRNVTINVDARPMIHLKDPNKVVMNIGLEYLPRSVGGQEEMEAGMATLSERLNGLILESGKPMVISQAADPTSDRKVTVEITATILR